MRPSTPPAKTTEDAMRFGIVYEISMPRPWGPETERQVYANCIEQCVLADQLGFDHVRAAEHHFFEAYSPCPAPEIFPATVAAKTEPIRGRREAGRTCRSASPSTPPARPRPAPERSASRRRLIDTPACRRFLMRRPRTAKAEPTLTILAYNLERGPNMLRVRLLLDQGMSGVGLSMRRDGGYRGPKAGRRPSGIAGDGRGFSRAGEAQSQGAAV
jgi:hypothetical protein